MRVWIGCLACYNEGRLVGDWYDADKAAEVPVSQVHRDGRIGADNGGAFTTHEELWCFDVDEVPHESLAREMSPAEAQDIADTIAAVDDPEAFAAYCDGIGVPFAPESVEGFEEAFCGTYDSREDYAQELADDMGAVPDEQPWPLGYIDWERAARDLFMDYFDAPAPGGRIYVFRSI